MSSSRKWIAAGFLLVATLSGCGYPAAEPVNMELITSLRTALSARNTEWLQANDALVEQRRSSGQMRDDEYEAFKDIIQQAREGQWVEAERASIEFQRAQRPTSEQIERVRKREV